MSNRTTHLNSRMCISTSESLSFFSNDWFIFGFIYFWFSECM